MGNKNKSKKKHSRKKAAKQAKTNQIIRNNAPTIAENITILQHQYRGMYGQEPAFFWRLRYLAGWALIGWTGLSLIIPTTLIIVTRNPYFAALYTNLLPAGGLWTAYFLRVIPMDERRYGSALLTEEQKTARVVAKEERKAIEALAKSLKTKK